MGRPGRHVHSRRLREAVTHAVEDQATCLVHNVQRVEGRVHRARFHRDNTCARRARGWCRVVKTRMRPDASRKSVRKSCAVFLPERILAPRRGAGGRRAPAAAAAAVGCACGFRAALRAQAAPAERQKGKLEVPNKAPVARQLPRACAPHCARGARRRSPPLSGRRQRKREDRDERMPQWERRGRECLCSEREMCELGRQW